MKRQPTRFQKILSTGFGSGYAPIAPGTIGALFAGLIWLIFYLALPHITYLIITIILLLLLLSYGTIAAGAVESMWGKDPRKVVVDEMAGVLIPLLFVPYSNKWYYYSIAAFILFRFFDIFKPLGIRKMEKFSGGIGIMADDILAGIYSALILIVTQWIIK